MATAERRPQSTGRPRRLRPFRLSLDQYHRIAEAGILTPRDRVVLLDGRLCSKMTKGNLHVAAIKLTSKALDRIIPDGFHVGVEAPIALPGGPWGGDSEPEPDVTVVRGEIRDYLDRKAGPADVPLVVEVADSSLYEDRKQLARYAWAGIPVAWIVNLLKRTVEVYTGPSGPGPDPRYATVETIGEGGVVPVRLDGQDRGAVAVRDILP